MVWSNLAELHKEPHSTAKRRQNQSDMWKTVNNVQLKGTSLAGIAEVWIHLI